MTLVFAALICFFLCAVFVLGFYLNAPIELIRIDYPKKVLAGEGFKLNITLRVHRRITEDCKFFIHLIGHDKLINADVDLPFACSKWEPGMAYELGPFIVYVPIDSKARNYEISAGLFYIKGTLDDPTFVRLLYRNPFMWGWSVGRIDVIKRQFKMEFPGINGYATAIENSLKKIFPEKQYFTGKAGSLIELEACRGEYEAAQLILIPGRNDLESVFLDKSDLVLESGGYSIDKSYIDLYRVGYVKTKKPYYNTPKVGLWPDPLIPIDEPFAISSNKVQPVWIRVYIPQSSPAGSYNGEIRIMSKYEQVKTIHLKVKVRDFDIGSQKHLNTAFGFKEYMLDKFYPKELDETDQQWRKRIKEISRVFYLDMLAHRIDPIHNIGNPAFLGKEGGKYMLDFTEFDKNAEFYLSYGQKNFGIGDSWSWQSEEMWAKWYGFTDVESVLGVFGTYGRHLQEKGWLDKAYAYTFDETFFRVKEVTGLIHQGHPGIKNLLTMPPDINYPDIDIWCPRINDFDSVTADYFKSNGKEVWMYVAGVARPYPNLNLDVEAAEHRIIPWILWKYSVQGFLYWCVNCWDLSDPWQDAMNLADQNGDGYLYYPSKNGPVGSVRLEVLRDGLEDYEYLFVLNERLILLKAKKEPRASALINEIEHAVRVKDEIVKEPAYYTRDPLMILKERRNISELIEKADRILRK